MLTAGAVTTLTMTLPSATASSTPVAVTLCGKFQLPGVNTSEPTPTLSSDASSELRPMVTSFSGAVPSTTSKVAVPPLSLVNSPLVGVTRIAGTGPIAALVTTMSSTPTASSLPGALLVMMRTCTSA